MFKPLLSTAKPLPRRRYLFGRRAVYWMLAVVVGVDLLLILMYTDGSWGRSKSPREITQQVSVTIQRVNPATNTIRVVGDLVGIMGMDVVVTPHTWIGVDRQLAQFGALRDGLRAKISFVHEGERRVARWIAASSARPGAAPSPAPAEVKPAPASTGGAATAAPATAVPAGALPAGR
jgi:hypothetical protein